MFKAIPVAISNLPQVLLFLAGIFYLLLSLRGFWTGRKPSRTAPCRRFALLMPAYNEEAVIGFAVESLTKLKYPRELFKIFVVADHCTDDTKSIAAAAGATVLDHSGPGLKAGKGRALKWAVAQILEAGGFDAFCYFDADSLAHPDFLEAANNHLAEGVQALQGRQLAKNTNNLLTRILASGHVVSNRFFQLPKQALGLSATLHGKGMCFTALIARHFPWDETCLTEDIEMQMRLIRHGVRIGWARDAVVYDEEPETIRQYVRRNIRWTSGSLDTTRRHLWALCSRAFRLGDLKAMEAAIYCAQTYRLAIIPLLAAVIWLTRDSFNLFIWLYYRMPGDTYLMKALVMLPLSLYPAAAILMERASPDLMFAYLLQPLLGVFRVPVFIGGIFRGREFWGRTEHTSRVAIADLVD